MGHFNATIEGVKKAKVWIKYNKIEVTPSVIRLWDGDVIVATMATPRVDLGRGDTLTLEGIKGKMETNAVTL